MEPQKQEPTLPPSRAVTTMAPSSTASAPSSLGASVPQDDAPGFANDTELIEKEWVDIVKRILREAKDDPYGLSKAITLLRADYMKKRYGKAIKLAD